MAVSVVIYTGLVAVAIVVDELHIGAFIYVARARVGDAKPRVVDSRTVEHAVVAVGFAVAAADGFLPLVTRARGLCHLYAETLALVGNLSVVALGGAGVWVGVPVGAAHWLVF